MLIICPSILLLKISDLFLEILDALYLACRHREQMSRLLIEAVVQFLLVLASRTRIDRKCKLYQYSGMKPLHNCPNLGLNSSGCNCFDSGSEK